VRQSCRLGIQRQHLDAPLLLAAKLGMKQGCQPCLPSQSQVGLTSLSCCTRRYAGVSCQLPHNNLMSLLLPGMQHDLPIVPIPASGIPARTPAPPHRLASDATAQ
jgi:hypothetical protein